jgi:signal transduction histidine kinase
MTRQDAAHASSVSPAKTQRGPRPKQASRAKDDFFLTVSHELRRPLSATLAWVSLLRSGKLDEATAARALETIERNAKAEERLIDDMLDVSRLVGGKIRLARRPVRLATLVAETIETVRPASDKGDIHVEMDARHGPDRISADPDRLRQVMENLLLNAIKFTPKGGRIVVRLGGDAQCATIAVCDTGRGIRPDLLPHIFERFWQGDAAATRLGGLGLGLAIVERLVELHGGTIEAASGGEGKGATFTLILPTHPGDGVDECDVPVRRSMLAYGAESAAWRPWITPTGPTDQMTGGAALR